MLISIVAPCRNEVRRIEAFLESVLAQETAGFDWELIVADGMSDDGTRDVLRSYSQRDSRIQVVDNPGRIVSTGLNAAIGVARGYVIARMDIHTIYASNYLRECVAVLEATGADNVGGAWWAVGDKGLSHAIAVAFQSRFCSGGARSHQVDYEGWADSVYLGCWKRTVFDRVGFFDPRLVRNQDDEFNLRLMKAGGRIWQSPRIVSWYSPRGSLSALFKQYAQYGLWKVMVIRKHGLPAAWRHVVPGLFVLSLGTLLLFSLVSVFTGMPSLSRLGWILLTAEMLIYLGACLGASLKAGRHHGWRLVPYLPVVFATYHFAYGVGFVMGLLGLSW